MQYGHNGNYCSHGEFFFYLKKVNCLSQMFQGDRGILALKGLGYPKVHPNSNTAPRFRASCVINTPLWQLYDPIPRSLTLHVSFYFYKSLSDSIALYQLSCYAVKPLTIQQSS